MNGSFEIKGYTIGEGRPVICVPIVASETEDIINKARELTEKRAQMVEWRVDMYAHVDDPEAVKSVLEAFRPMFRETILLFTFRTKKQGGCSDLAEKKILYLNELAAKSGCVDLVDLEFFEASRPEKEIRRFQKMGVRIIASHHDFHGTPDERIMRMLMDQMNHGGADIAKLAVMPNSVDDVLRLLKLTNDTRHQYPDLPIVTMAMGKYGVISRVSGEVFGSCITFGADGEVSAPGQMQMDRLAMVLDALHESM